MKDYDRYGMNLALIASGKAFVIFYRILFQNGCQHRKKRIL